MPGHALPQLLVPRVDAEEKISAQIKKGREIVGSLTSGLLPPDLDPHFHRTFERAEEDQKNWTQYTIDLLKSLFSDQSIARQFGPSFPSFDLYDDPIKAFVREMNERIRRLQSIVQRINLFPVSAAETKAVTTVAPTRQRQQTPDIFIVHGHDDAAKHEVARLLEQLGLHPIILHEQPDRGRTIIEKFEDHAKVGFAVVLLTPDDIGYPKDTHTDAKPRARQNVVLELGFFLGKLGRAGVCALLKDGVEIPNDYAGVLYKPMDAMGAWKFALAKEIKEAGIEVDLNKIL